MYLDESDMIGRTAQQAKVTAPEVHGPSLGVSDKLFPHTAPLLHATLIVCEGARDNNVDHYQVVEILNSWCKRQYCTTFLVNQHSC